MVRTIALFTEFCYIVRRHVLDDDDIDKLNTLLVQFHQEREIFCEAGIRPDGFCLPRQHSLKHYANSIMKFGAPNGLCSSITESKHIKAVKKPWRRSSRFNALSQMLLTNQRLDKLAAITVDFNARGMLAHSIWDGAIAQPAPQQPKTRADDEDEDGETVDDRNIISETKLAIHPGKLYFLSVFVRFTPYVKVPHIPRELGAVSAWLGVPDLPQLISRFLYHQEHGGSDLDSEDSDADIPLTACPQYNGRVNVYPSATSTYFAPSDKSGLGGLFRERIHSVPIWRGGPARRDCIFIEHSPNLAGFRGLHVAQVYAFLKLKHNRKTFPCALINYFSTIDDEPCTITGMWKVRCDIDNNGQRILDIVHLDAVLQGAHLIGISGDRLVPRELDHTNALDAFKTFYVNKYVDYHAHKIAF